MEIDLSLLTHDEAAAALGISPEKYAQLLRIEAGEPGDLYNEDGSDPYSGSGILDDVDEDPL